MLEMLTAMITITMKIVILMEEIVVVVAKNTAVNASVRIQVIQTLIQVSKQMDIFISNSTLGNNFKNIYDYLDCKTVEGDSCKFPFEYKGKTYEACTLADSKTKFWCATYTIGGKYVPGLYGECEGNCTKECGK